MIAVPRMGAFVSCSVPSELAALVLVPGEGGEITASWGDAAASAESALLKSEEGVLISNAVGMNGSTCWGW